MTLAPVSGLKKNGCALMANQLGLIHPNMLTRLQPNFYPSSCTIQEATEAADSYGQLIPTWGNLAEHVDLNCRIAPEGGSEQRAQIQVYAIHQWRVALNGYYPTIIETMRAVVDGVTYEIEQVVHDGNDKMTRLSVRTLD